MVNVLYGPDGARAEHGNQSLTRMHEAAILARPTSYPARTDPTAAKSWEIWSERVITLVDEIEPEVGTVRTKVYAEKDRLRWQKCSLYDHHGQSGRDGSLGVGGLRASERLSGIRVQEERRE